MKMDDEKLDFDFFTEEQRSYLNMLVKFAGRTHRMHVPSSQSTPSKKYTYLRENFAMLSIEEQFEFNESLRHLDDRKGESYAIAGLFGVGIMAYFVITRPLQRNLYFEIVKSIVMGGSVGLGYYQVNNYWFREEMHKLYIQLLNRKKLSPFGLPDVTITMGPVLPSPINDTEVMQTVYSYLELNQEFNLQSFPALSCTPPELARFKVMTLQPQPLQQEFQLPMRITNNGTDPLYITKLVIYDLLSYQNITILPSQQFQRNLNINETQIINIPHQCNATTTNTNYWDMKQIQLTFSGHYPIIFEYQFICNPNYHPNRFDWSNIIFLIFISVTIWQLAKFGKIYSFRVVFRRREMLLQSAGPEINYQTHPPFQGFRLFWPQGVTYVIILIISMILSLKYETSAESIMLTIVYVLVTICTFHFFDEMICSLKYKVPILVQPIAFLKLSEVIAAIITFILMYCYIHFEEPWFLSDILTICILGSLVKLFKITSVRNAIQFFGVVMIADIVCCIYLGYAVRYEWDSLILKYFNTPLSAQIPYFETIYNKKCGWVSVFNILFPGFFLGYVHRFDRCKGTYVYEIISFLGLMVGLILWVVVQYLISFPLPTSIFTEVLMIVICATTAYARNELKIFWSGLFYDELIFDPFKTELDQQSMIELSFFGIGATYDLSKSSQNEKHSETQLVNSSRINSDVFKGLSGGNLGQFRAGNRIVPI